MFVNCTKTILSKLPSLVITRILKKQLYQFLLYNYFSDTNTVFCDVHAQNSNNFFEIIVDLLVDHYIKNTNKVLESKDLRKVKQDPPFNLAFEQL